jgi:hypothetical protein
VNQSNTFPKKFTDFRKENSEELANKDNDMTQQAFLAEFVIPINPKTRRILGGLGSHDLSAMREIIRVSSICDWCRNNFSIWSALLQYGNFSVMYESGFNNGAVFDAHIEVYIQNKIVRVNIDSPYVKCLPTTITVREQTTGPRGEPCYQERTLRTTYEDAYTSELKEWDECVISDRAPKTIIDAL